MSPRPPPWLEACVGALVPAACREPVLGDLTELYRSPRHYVLDALGVLPGVITARVRRTISLPQLLLGSFLLFGLLQATGGPWPAAAAATLLAMAMLTLRHAYALPLATASLPALLRRGAADVAVLAAAVLTSQLLIAVCLPLWQLPPALMLRGLTMFCVLHFVLGVQCARGIVWPPADAGVMPAHELLQEARGFEAGWRRALRIELGAIVVILGVCTWLLLTATRPVIQLAVAVTAAGTLLAGWVLLRLARQPRDPLPDGLPFSQCRAVYQYRLKQRWQAARTHLWWYLPPLLIGPASLCVGMALQQSAPWTALSNTLAGMAAFAGLLAWMGRRTRDRLQRRIEQLPRVREKL